MDINITTDIMAKQTEEETRQKYEYAKEHLILFAEGNSNWDIFADTVSHPGKCFLFSIAKPGSGASNSHFGDCSYVRELIRQGFWRDTLTPEGEKLMKKF